MAHITYVKSAQQRYETVPVIDPETGKQKETPVMRSGAQRVTKSGRPIFMKVTAEDRTKPKPNRSCDKCGEEITVGSPYKHITPKSGPYGGTKRVRCDTCPNWHVWEYSNSMSSRLSQISHDFERSIADATAEDDAVSARDDAANAVRELAEEKRESSQNIEDGFGHETSQSQELNDTADSLDTWAGEIEACNIPEFPVVEEADCETCGGTGTQKGGDTNEDEDGVDTECPDCDGSGKITPDELSDDQIEFWRQEVTDACSIVDESPV